MTTEAGPTQRRQRGMPRDYDPRAEVSAQLRTVLLCTVPGALSQAPSVAQIGGFGLESPRHLAGCVREAMRRTLVWIDTERFRGWGCSDCAWVFNPTGSPVGESLEEMKENDEQRRDREVAAHDCAAHGGRKAQTERLP